MYKVMRTFICRGCVNPVTGTGCTSVYIGGDASVKNPVNQVDMNRSAHAKPMVALCTLIEQFASSKQNHKTV